eukprot:733807-Prymnesium_polylepis.1
MPHFKYSSLPRYLHNRTQRRRQDNTTHRETRCRGPLTCSLLGVPFTRNHRDSLQGRMRSTAEAQHTRTWLDSMGAHRPVKNITARWPPRSTTTLSLSAHSKYSNQSLPST